MSAVSSGDEPVGDGALGEGITSSASDALRSALDAEHAAVYGYGVLGGILGDDSALANAGYAAHRARRDRLVSLLGADAPAAKAVYELPFAVSNAAQARRLGAEIERRCAAVYADVVSRTTGKHRMWAARTLTECAVRTLEWGAEPVTLPGLEGRR